MDKSLTEKINSIISEFEENENKLNNSEIINDSKKYSFLSKQQSKLQSKYKISKKYLNLISEKSEIESFIKNDNDKEMISMFREQLKEVNAEIDKTYEILEETLIETDPADDLQAIIEIEGRVGGDEANIFCGDLFEMYKKYSNKIGFNVKIIDSSPNEQGGYSRIQFLIEGDGSYGYFRYESGIHRVQRIPQTETNGRVHTSTASVVVTPEIDSSIEININPKDIRIDTYRSGGKGGQHANKTDSAVRITHIPTNIVATSQEGRSQHDNKERAMTILKSRLYDLELQEQQSQFSASRRNVIGTADRSEKIRTYNYPQNRLTDHRVSLTLKKLDRIMDGGLGEVIDYIRAMIRNETKS